MPACSAPTAILHINFIIANYKYIYIYRKINYLIIFETMLISVPKKTIAWVYNIRIIPKRQIAIS